MVGLLNTVVWAGGALFAVAAGVACWEQWRQSKQGRPPSLAAPQKAVNVDLDVDTLQVFPASDFDKRIATLGCAMDRMTGAAPVQAAAPAPGNWIETRPMVSLTPEVEAEHH